MSDDFKPPWRVLPADTPIDRDQADDEDDAVGADGAPIEDDEEAGGEG